MSDAQCVARSCSRTHRCLLAVRSSGSTRWSGEQLRPALSWGGKGDMFLLVSLLFAVSLLWFTGEHDGLVDFGCGSLLIGPRGAASVFRPLVNATSCPHHTRKLVGGEEEASCTESSSVPSRSDPMVFLKHCKCTIQHRARLCP